MNLGANLEQEIDLVVADDGHRRIIKDELSKRFQAPDIRGYIDTGEIEESNLLHELESLDVQLLLQRSDYSSLQTEEEFIHYYAENKPALLIGGVAFAGFGVLPIFIDPVVFIGALVGPALVVSSSIFLEGVRGAMAPVYSTLRAMLRLRDSSATEWPTIIEENVAIPSPRARSLSLIFAAIAFLSAAILIASTGLSGLLGIAYYTALWVVLARLSMARFRESILSAYAALLLRITTVRASSTEQAIHEKWVARLEPELDKAVRFALNSQLSETHSELLIPLNPAGLQLIYDPKVIIDSASERRLKATIGQMDGGTVAICGPRGSGKTTLLRRLRPARIQGVSSNAIRVFTTAPSEYDTRDFIANLVRRVGLATLETLEGRRKPDASESRPRVKPIHRLVFAIRSFLVFSARLVARLLIVLGILVGGWHFVADKVPEPESILDSVRAWADSLQSRVSAGYDSLGWTWFLQPPQSAVVGGLIAVLGFVSLMVIKIRSSPQGEYAIAVKIREILRQADYELSQSRRISYKIPMSVTEVGAESEASSSRKQTNLPDLVDAFVGLASEISEFRAPKSCGLVIAIDELDRLGTPERVQAFLGEIKGIFEARNVIYLLTATADVGEAQLARRITGASTVDNVIDAVVMVDGLTLSETSALLQERVTGFTDPFVRLAYAISGGNPRETVRVARRLCELADASDRESGMTRARSRGVADLAAHICQDEVRLVLRYMLATLEGPHSLRDEIGKAIFSLDGGYLAPAQLMTVFSEFRKALVGSQGSMHIRSLEALIATSLATTWAFSGERVGPDSRPPSTELVEGLAACRQSIVNRPELTLEYLSALAKVEVGANWEMPGSSLGS